MREAIYVLYDRAAQIALKPCMIHRNDVAPVREVTELTRNPDSIIHRHPQDFQLLHVADINLETLEVTPLPEPRIVLEAKDATEKREPLPAHGT